jgi:hypothetical protein
LPCAAERQSTCSCMSGRGPHRRSHRVVRCRFGGGGHSGRQLDISNCASGAGRGCLRHGAGRRETAVARPARASCRAAPARRCAVTRSPHPRRQRTGEPTHALDVLTAATRADLARLAGEEACASAGVVIDGVVTPLQGEPPVAVTHGWGDLTWLYRPRG